KSRVTVLAGGLPLQLDLALGAGEINSKILSPRVSAETLPALEVHLGQINQFITYLAHIRGFILPLALGDCYYALGDYAHAETYYLLVRDYPFLNLTIERPMVWLRLARTYLKWGKRLYQDRDAAAAHARFELIVKITSAGFELSGPLYEGTFTQ